MKILHTSDWHIGQRFHGKDRYKDHEFFFKWLTDTINEQNIDMLLVAGDIFDIGYPPNQALKQYFRFLMNLQNSCCKHVIIIGGNHDYISTLNAPGDILKVLDIHVIGGATENIEDEIIEIKNSSGEIECVVCAVPFLRDRDIRKAVAGESYNDKLEAIKKGINQHYKTLGELTKKYKEVKIPIIATGHLLAAGSALSDSEREIHIGNLDSVNSSTFGTYFDYVALGHIHRPQAVGGNDKIRYSGAPIPLSFSEIKDEKKVIVVETKYSSIETKDVTIPQFRKLVRFKGDINKIEEEISQYTPEGESENWAEIRITEEQYDPVIIDRFNKLKEGKVNLDIISASLQFGNKIRGTNNLYNDHVSLKDLSDKEVFEKLLEKSNIDNREEYLLSYNELIEQLDSYDK